MSLCNDLGPLPDSLRGVSFPNAAHAPMSDVGGDPQITAGPRFMRLYLESLAARGL